MVCRLLLLLTLLAAPFLRAAESASFSAANYARVDVAPTKTSIYIGVVSMTMPTFERSGDTYVARYDAKVIPYFFYNESGKLSVDITAAQLEQLARGEPIDFHGQAVNDAGEGRRVEGRATPADALSGKLKVRVFVTKRTQLIFNTTYQFRAAEPVGR